MWTEVTRAKYDRSGLRYASDVTDAEWALIAPHVLAETPLGRRRETNLREEVNALLYRHARQSPRHPRSSGRHPGPGWRGRSSGSASPPLPVVAPSLCRRRLCRRQAAQRSRRGRRMDRRNCQAPRQCPRLRGSAPPLGRRAYPSPRACRRAPGSGAAADWRRMSRPTTPPPGSSSPTSACSLDVSQGLEITPFILSQTLALRPERYGPLCRCTPCAETRHESRACQG